MKRCLWRTPSFWPQHQGHSPLYLRQHPISDNGVLGIMSLGGVVVELGDIFMVPFLSITVLLYSTTPPAFAISNDTAISSGGSRAYLAPASCLANCWNKLIMKSRSWVISDVNLVFADIGLPLNVNFGNGVPGLPLHLVTAPARVLLV